MKNIYILFICLIIFYFLTLIYKKNIKQEKFDPSLVPVSSIVTLAKVAQKLVDGGGTLTNPSNLNIGTSSAPGNLTVTGNSILGTPGSTSLSINGNMNVNGNLRFKQLPSTINLGTPISEISNLTTLTPTATQVIINGQTILQANTWNTSTDKINRLLYNNNDSTTYSSPINHIFQTNGNTTMTIDNTGNITNKGNIITHNLSTKNLNTTNNATIYGNLNVSGTDSTGSGILVGKGVRIGSGKICLQRTDSTWACITPKLLNAMNNNLMNAGWSG